jgi:Fe-S-cluster containining protein
LSFDYPRNVRFLCNKCAICCGDTEERDRSILLLRIEAKRTAQKTQKATGEFAEKIEGSEPYVYRMKKTRDGKCVFLKDSRCSIYDIRPLICRFYPFQLKKVGSRELVFAYTNKCLGIGKGPRLKRSFFEKLFKESARIMAEDTGKDLSE